jgi:hypothetical protein
MFHMGIANKAAIASKILDPANPADPQCWQSQSSK